MVIFRRCGFCSKSAAFAPWHITSILYVTIVSEFCLAKLSENQLLIAIIILIIQREYLFISPHSAPSKVAKNDSKASTPTHWGILSIKPEETENKTLWSDRQPAYEGIYCLSTLGLAVVTARMQRSWGPTVTATANGVHTSLNSAQNAARSWIRTEQDSEDTEPQNLEETAL